MWWKMYHRKRKIIGYIGGKTPLEMWNYFRKS